MHRIEALLAHGSAHTWLTSTDARKRLVSFGLCLGRGECEASFALCLVKVVRIFTHIVSDFGDVIKVSRPFCNAVRRLFAL